MSYGYLISSDKLVPTLQKNRRFRFSLLECVGGLYFYSRLEEGSELTIRQGEASLMTTAGKSFFASIPAPFFLVDYLLTKKLSEAGLAQIVAGNVKSGNFESIQVSSNQRLVLNSLYRILS